MKKLSNEIDNRRIKLKKFIVFDGQHGVGKSYIVDRLYNKLILKGYPVIKTNEPTNSEIGLLARKSENFYTANTLACLFAADRLQHCQQIQKWLNEDKIVISDRYIISGLILQNMDGVHFDYIRIINSGIIMPDLSVIMYADANIIKERQKNKALSRLAKQEQVEKYDRYLKCSDELKVMFQNVCFFPNNSFEEGNKIVEYVIRQIED